MITCRLHAAAGPSEQSPAVSSSAVSLSHPQPVTMYLWLMGPTPFFSDFKDAKKLFFSIFFSYNLPSYPQAHNHHSYKLNFVLKFCVKILFWRIISGKGTIRILEVQKYPDPDPQHWYWYFPFCVHPDTLFMPNTSLTSRFFNNSITKKMLERPPGVQQLSSSNLDLREQQQWEYKPVLWSRIRHFRSMRILISETKLNSNQI